MLGEEYGDSRAGTSVAWIVDPIDGTHNFMRGVPLFGTLLAVGRDDELQVGLMSAPALGSRWWAFRGGGAWARDADGRTRHRCVEGRRPAPMPSCCTDRRPRTAEAG